jgi:hypothetical protein
MDKKSAQNLIINYTKNFDQFKHFSNGDFMGGIGAAKVKYDLKNKTLIAWGVISSFAHKYQARPKHFEEIKSITLPHKELTLGGILEIIKFPEFIDLASKQNKEPWLVLRIEFKNRYISNMAFLQTIEYLTDIVFSQWKYIERKAAINVNSQYELPKLEQIKIMEHDKPKKNSE